MNKTCMFIFAALTIISSAQAMNFTQPTTKNQSKVIEQLIKAGNSHQEQVKASSQEKDKQDKQNDEERIKKEAAEAGEKMKKDLAKLHDKIPSNLKRFAKFHDAFSDEAMAKQSIESQNHYRDSFIKAAVRTATSIASAAVNKTVPFVTVGSNIFNGMAQEWDKAAMDKILPESIAQDSDHVFDRYLQYEARKMYLETSVDGHLLGSLYKATKAVNQTLSEKLSAGADKIGLTDDNVKKIASSVDDFVKKAPGYIQDWWTKLKENTTEYAKYITQKIKDIAEAKPQAPSTQAASVADKFSGKAQSKTTKLPNSKTKPIHASKHSSVQQPDKNKENQTKLVEQLKEFEEEYFAALDAQIKAKQSAEEAIKLQEAQEKHYWIMRDTLADGFQGLAAAAYIFGDTQSSQKIATFGAASMQLFDSVKALTTTASVATGITSIFSMQSLSLIHPYVGIVSAVAGFMSLFADDNNDSNQQLMEAIRHMMIQLSKQIADLHNDMIKRFNGIEKQLKQQQIALLKGFFALQQETGDIKEALKKLQKLVADNQDLLQSNVGYTNQVMSDYHAMLADNLESLRIEDIHDLVGNALETAKKENLSHEEFEQYITQLYTKATTRAKSDHLTGGAVDINNMHEIQNALKQRASKTIWVHPAFSNINLLKNYVNNHLCKTSGDPLVNPLLWIQCTETILTLFNKKCETDKHYPVSKEQQALDVEKLRKLHSEGEKIVAFIEELNKHDCLKELLQDYINSLVELSKIIKEHIARYEAERTQETRAAHVKLLEFELTTVSTLSTECPGCMKHMEDAYKFTKAYQTRGGRNESRGIRPDKALTYFMYRDIGPIKIKSNKNKGLLAHLIKVRDELMPAELQEVSACVSEKRCAVDSTKKLYQLFKDFKTQTEQEKLKLINSSYMKLYHDDKEDMLPVNALIYPADKESYQAILCFPQENIPVKVDSLYCIAQKLNLGTISYEYSIEEGFFSIKALFSQKGDTKKVIAHARKKYDHSLYSNNENAQHFWYGGRYQKNNDVIKIPYQRAALLDGPEKSNGKPVYKTSYYPPVNGYQAERDIFGITAEKVAIETELIDKLAIQKQVAAAYAQERSKFAKTLSGQTQPSTNSKTFKAIQQLDVRFKLLESMLMFMYNELIVQSVSPQVDRAHSAILDQAKSSKSKNYSSIIETLLEKGKKNIQSQDTVKPTSLKPKDEGQKSETPVANEADNNRQDLFHYFASLKRNKLTYLKDAAAINKYLEEYAQPNSELSKQDIALQHIEQTKEMIQKTFTGIFGLKLQAGFKRVVQVLSGLNTLIETYNGRSILPPLVSNEDNQLMLVKKLLEQRDREIEQRDKQIILAKEEKSQLTEIVKNTQQELTALREQMKVMMEILTKTQKQ